MAESYPEGRDRRSASPGNLMGMGSSRHAVAVLLMSVLGTGCVYSRVMDSGARDRGATAEPVDPAPVPETREGPVVAAEPTPWREIGRSVEGRPLRVRTIGSGHRRVLWIGGIHGNEPEGVVATESLPAAFAAAGLAGSHTLMILEDINPDGRAANERWNSNGVDLNRNFPARNFDMDNPRFGGRPLTQPESRALHELILDWQPNLVIVSHAWSGRYFINYDGPAREIAARFAKTSGYPLVPSSSFNATPGSLGSWVGNTLGWPILTLEYLKGKDPDVAWDETREAILQAIGDI